MSLSVQLSPNINLKGKSYELAIPYVCDHLV